VQKYAGVMQAGQQAAQNDPALAAEFQKIQNTDVDNVGKQKMVENSPHVIAFLKQHGMTAKQFVFIPQVLMTAAIAAEAQQQGGKSVGFVNPANIDFVKQHKQELDKLQLMGGGAEEQQQQ
jgi:hypothetical protein